MLGVVVFNNIFHFLSVFFLILLCWEGATFNIIKYIHFPQKIQDEFWLEWTVIAIIYLTLCPLTFGYLVPLTKITTASASSIVNNLPENVANETRDSSILSSVTTKSDKKSGTIQTKGNSPQPPETNLFPSVASSSMVTRGTNPPTVGLCLQVVHLRPLVQHRLLVAPVLPPQYKVNLQVVHLRPLLQHRLLVAPVLPPRYRVNLQVVHLRPLLQHRLLVAPVLPPRYRVNLQVVHLRSLLQHRLLVAPVLPPRYRVNLQVVHLSPDQLSLLVVPALPPCLAVEAQVRVVPENLTGVQSTEVCDVSVCSGEEGEWYRRNP
jgi:hypothetical protein